MFHSIGIIICGKIYMWIFLLFVYFYSEVLQISKVNYRTPFIDLTPPHFCFCPKARPVSPSAAPVVVIPVFRSLGLDKGNIFLSYLLFCILRVAIRKNPISVPLLCYLDFENFMSRHEYSSNTKILIICQSIVKQHSINQSINRWNKSGQDHSSCSFPDSGIPSTNPLYLGNLYRESRDGSQNAMYFNIFNTADAVSSP